MLLSVMWVFLNGMGRTQRQLGQGLVEYALILIFVAVVLILLLTLLGPGVANFYSNIVQELQNP